MRLMLDGYYGMQNTGDDVFCVVGLDEARRRGADSVSFLAHRLPVLPGPARPVLARAPGFRGGRRTISALAAVTNRRVVHFGGSTFRRMNRHRRDQDLLARAGLLDLHAVGISIGPFRDASDERDTVRFLERFRSIAVRDAASAERAAALGLDVVVGFDVAVLLPTVEWASVALATPPHSQRILGISVCPVESEGDDRRRLGQLRVERMAAAVKSVSQTAGPLAVRILEFNGHANRGDGGISAALVEALHDTVPVELFRYTGDVRDMLCALTSCHALIGMRLHSGILAYTYRVPFALVDYHPKCRDFASTVGLSEERLLESSLGDADRFIGALEQILSTDATTATSLSVEDAQAVACRGLEQFARG